MKRTAPLFIVIAGVLWGLMGIFVRKLETYDFSSLQIASLRIIFGALIFLLVTGIIDRNKLKIKRKDIGLFLGLGICSILLFTVCYFTTISMASLSIAAILLYTAPIMVMLMSLVLFKEKMTLKKTVVLLMAFVGCVLVTGIGSGQKIPATAMVIGLMSGVGYGLYSILGTFALRKYEPLTVTTYAFLCGGIGALIICNPIDIVKKIHIANNSVLLFGLIILTAFLTAVLPYLFYTVGLASVKASSAAIMASIEPVVATIAGVVLFHEKLSITAFLGILLVLAGITILNLSER